MDNDYELLLGFAYRDITYKRGTFGIGGTCLLRKQDGSMTSVFVKAPSAHTKAAEMIRKEYKYMKDLSGITPKVYGLVEVMRNGSDPERCIGLAMEREDGTLAGLLDSG